MRETEQSSHAYGMWRPQIECTKAEIRPSDAPRGARASVIPDAFQAEAYSAVRTRPGCSWPAATHPTVRVSPDSSPESPGWMQVGGKYAKVHAAGKANPIFCEHSAARPQHIAPASMLATSSVSAGHLDFRRIPSLTRRVTMTFPPR